MGSRARRANSRDPALDRATYDDAPAVRYYRSDVGFGPVYKAVAGESVLWKWDLDEKKWVPSRLTTVEVAGAFGVSPVSRISKKKAMEWTDGVE